VGGGVEEGECRKVIRKHVTEIDLHYSDIQVAYMQAACENVELLD
jgi:hypothetical protein